MNTFFNFHHLKTTYKKELIGAFSTFSAMVYIIVVHPTILSEAGLPFGAVMTTTIIVTAFATLLMSLLAKLPFAVAPGMGVSAYFTFTVIQKNHLPISLGLFVIFLSSLIIIVLNIFNIRKKILDEIPDVLIYGITGGIGLFLIAVGLKHINIIQVTETTHTFNFKDLVSIPMLLTIFGLGIIYLFEKLGLTFGFILVILTNWIIALIFNLVPYHGIVAFPPSIAPIFCKFSPVGALSFDFFKAFFSIFLVTLFDSSAGLITLKRMLPVEAQHFSMKKALFPDCIGSFAGSFLGTTSLAIHLESMAGVHSGSKSGFSALCISGLFLLCLFFYPLASTVPTFASAPVIMAIGFMMTKQLKNLKGHAKIDWIVPIIAALVMPFTMSLYMGFEVGFVGYTLIQIAKGKYRSVSPVVYTLSSLFFLEILLRLISFFE
jgi:AGZA family xanthine/uracil permease-like MFS transporter